MVEGEKYFFCIRESKRESQREEKNPLYRHGVVYDERKGNIQENQLEKLKRRKYLQESIKEIFFLKRND